MAKNISIENKSIMNYWLKTIFIYIYLHIQLAKELFLTPFSLPPSICKKLAIGKYFASYRQSSYRMFNSYSMSNIFLVSHVLLLMYFTRLNAPEIKRKNINSEPCYNLCVLPAPLLNLERKLWKNLWKVCLKVCGSSPNFAFYSKRIFKQIN